MSSKLEALHSQPPWKSVLSNSIPSMISMIMVLIYNIADLYFVGQTDDTLKVSAVSLATPVYLFFMAFGNVFGIGGTSVCSIAFGAGDTDKVKKVSCFCLWTSVGLGFILSLGVFLFIDPIVTLLGAGEDVFTMVKDYVVIITFSGPLVLISFCMSNLVRAEGRPREAMFGLLLGNLINIILDPILILTLNMGVQGAGIATLIGNVSSGIYYIFYLLKGKSFFNANIKTFTLDFQIIKSVLIIGIPSSLSTFFMSVSQITLNYQMSQYGDLAVAAIGVAVKISMFTSMIFIGLGQGIGPLFGYCIGARNKTRYKGIMKFSLIFAFCLSSLITFICYLTLDLLVGAFLSEAEAFELAYNFSELRLTTAVLFGMFYVLINALQAAGLAKSALTVNISRQGLIFIPALFILGERFGIMGLVLAQPVADVLSFILVTTLYLISSRSLFKEINVEKQSIKV